ncbi:MAG: endoglucanase [Marinilabiliales bacterium]|nr:MAG: endoglucanase [Marinilabiliales bacterium]
MKINFKLLKSIVETAGVSGFEGRIRKLIQKEIEQYVDDVSIDNMGNLIAFRKGESDKSVMLAAHMDEIGFIVNHIDDNGFLRFHPLGGFDPKTLTAQRVVVHGKKDLMGVMGAKPIHVMKPDERKKSVEISDFFIDLGLPKKEVDKYVDKGNSVSRCGDLIQLGDCVNGKSLDNRISVFVLIEALKKLSKKKLPFDLYAVFTVQEEVGIRGAQVATQAIQPDFGLAIDTTIAYDVPGSVAHEQVTVLGDGPAIKIMDSSAIADYRMIDYLKTAASEQKIKYQVELLPAGGTDTAMVQRMTKSGSIAGAVSIPTRHIHQVIESCHTNDVGNAVNLIVEAVLKMDQYNWLHQ